MKTKKMKCPSGHKLGADIDNYDDCDSCKIWEDCKMEASKIKEVQRKWSEFMVAYESLRGYNTASDGETFKSAIQCLLYMEECRGCGNNLTELARISREILEKEKEFAEKMETLDGMQQYLNEHNINIPGQAE